MNIYECLWCICETPQAGDKSRLLLAANCLWWFGFQATLRWNYHFEDLVSCFFIKTCLKNTLTFIQAPSVAIQISKNICVVNRLLLSKFEDLRKKSSAFQQAAGNALAVAVQKIVIDIAHLN